MRPAPCNRLSCTIEALDMNCLQRTLMMYMVGLLEDGGKGVILGHCSSCSQPSPCPGGVGWGWQ